MKKSTMTRFNNEGHIMIWFLMFIPIFIILIYTNITHISVVTGSDVDLQGALNMASRSAAMQVVELSQAELDPRIDSNKAHEIFKSYLSKNLLLYDNLIPKDSSLLEEPPEYVFVVYNGNSDYATSGAHSCSKFTFKEGNLSSENILTNDTNYGRKFYIYDKDIDIVLNSYDSDYSIETVLDSPGVVAVVKAKVKHIGEGNTIDTVRWVSAVLNVK